MRDYTLRYIIFSFTRKGTELNEKICKICYDRNIQHEGYTVSKFASGNLRALPRNTRDFIGRNWGKAELIFIGATGIAIRHIAPWVVDKFTDPAVIVVDEEGRYVIPVLSGHMGGATKVADRIAEAIGGIAIQTTATDVQGKFAVDVFARENSLVLTDRKAAKEISAAVLEGETIGLYVENGIPAVSGDVPAEVFLCKSREDAEKYRHVVEIDYSRGPWEENKNDDASKDGWLVLRPKDIIMGVGSRKLVGKGLFEENLRHILSKNGVGMNRVAAMASIDLKREEPALRSLAEMYRIPFVTYSAEELSEVEGVSSGSEFVESVTGVDNVCERAARLYCEERYGDEGELVQEKWIGEQVTVALVRRPKKLYF